MNQQAPEVMELMRPARRTPTTCLISTQTMQAMINCQLLQYALLLLGGRILRYFGCRILIRLRRKPTLVLLLQAAHSIN